MERFHKPGRFVPACLILVALIFAGAFTARAQSIGELNSELSALAPQVSEAMHNQSVADQAIDRLDKAEQAFARLAANPKVDKGELIGVYSRLEDMLNRMYSTYKKKKDDCIAQISTGANCDYTAPEELELKALYPLSWLHFQGAQLYSNEPEQARRLLNQAIDGFTESTLAIFQPDLLRENLLGRAFCERELGKYDKSQYDKAIADFKQIMKDGQNTRQYRAALQGLATTYAAMGKMDEAAKLTGKLAMGATGAQAVGLAMFRLQQLFKAEAATNDPARRAEYHKEAVEFMRAKENDKRDWPVVVAAVAQYVRDPVAEFGRSSDPFEKWLLANVLYSKHQAAEAAKYYLEAAQSGKYPRAYKYAADIYYNEKRYDLVEQIANQIARQPGNPDAQWAAYMRFKLPQSQWEMGGMKNAQLENQWVAAAQDYLKTYPHGQFAYDPHFWLADRMQRNKQYLDAAKEFALVTGSPYFEFMAKFRGAKCDYSALAAAGGKGAKAPAVDRDALRKAALSGFQEALRMAPAAERSASGQQRTAVREARGEATYLLASMLQHQPTVDDQRIVTLLQGFEQNYANMNQHFNEVAEWRLVALDRLGQYDEAERDLKAVLERSKGVSAANDFIKELGLDFWRAAQARKAKGDMAGAISNARLTTVTYDYFEDQVRAGKAQAKNLTGTLSILGKAYLVMNDVPKAEEIFNQVVKADPGSPDANAGLARIDQAKKDYKDALELWTRVESVAAESDDLWYEAKYNLALVFAAQGNVQEACRKLAVTRAEHPSLGTPEMKAQWDALQRKLCLGQGGAAGR
jgi:TolA-binding protein